MTADTAVPHYIEFEGALYVVADMIHCEILRNAPHACAYVRSGFAHRSTDALHLGACSCRSMTQRDALTAYEKVARSIESMTRLYPDDEKPMRVRQ